MLLRWLFTSFLAIQLTGIHLDAVAKSRPDDLNVNIYLYLPYIAYGTPLQVVVTSAGFPSERPEYTVTGYIVNHTGEPFYDVSVVVTLTITSTEMVPTTSTYIDHIDTVFPATLPGQPNPFIYSLRRARPDLAAVESIHIATARTKLLSDPTYATLNTSNWITANGQIGGTVLNDSLTTLRNIQAMVMMIGNASCTTHAAGIMTTTLTPSGTLPYFTYVCPPAVPYPVAQGEVVL